MGAYGIVGVGVNGEGAHGDGDKLLEGRELDALKTLAVSDGRSAAGKEGGGRGRRSEPGNRGKGGGAGEQGRGAGGAGETGSEHGLSVGDGSGVRVENDEV